MGKTESFLPGSWKAVDESDGCSAAAAVAAVWLVVESAAAEAAFEDVSVGILLTVERPLTWMPDAGGTDVVEKVAAVRAEDPDVPITVSERLDVPVDVAVAAVEVWILLGDIAVENVLEVENVPSVFNSVDAAVVVKVSDVAELNEVPLPFSLPLLLPESEHFLTSSTAGFPFSSVVGERVMTHV